MGEVKTKLHVLYSDRLSTLIVKANNMNIKKEDIVSLVKDNGQFMLVYYGNYHE